MKHHYMSERDFFYECSCGSNLRSYVETLIPSNTQIDFVIASKSDSEKDSYQATYDILTPSGSVAERLEVSYTLLPDRTAEYKVISRSQRQ